MLYPQVTSSSLSLLDVWQIKMMEAFLLNSSGEYSCCASVVARATLKLEQWLEQQWRKDSSKLFCPERFHFFAWPHTTGLSEAFHAYMTGRCGSITQKTSVLLAVLLLLFEVPSPHSLSLQSQQGTGSYYPVALPWRMVRPHSITFRGVCYTIELLEGF